MKTQKTIFLAMILLLIASLTLPLGCAKEPKAKEPETTWTELPTYVRPRIYPDPNLQDVLGDALFEVMDPDTLYVEPCMVTILDGSNRGIIDLTGLQLYCGLIHVYFNDNQISDIAPLSYCFLIEELILSNNQVRDISPLTKLTKLSYLSLAKNQISDISPLSSLIKLSFLDLRDNQISNISSLSSLSNLSVLDLRRNKIKDISALTALTNLSYLFLAENQISDISPLVANNGLGEGDTVSLEGNDLDLREGSKDMKNIRALEARGVTVKYGPVEVHHR